MTHDDDSDIGDGGKNTESSDELFKQEGETELLYDPQTKSHVPIVDSQETITEVSERNQPSQQEIDAFREHRSKLIQYVDVLRDSARSTQYFPPPGGVGAGVFFNDGLFDFQDRTAIFWYIVAPTQLGGNPRPFLYLTASNHASKGCEALVSYQEAGQGVFRVWDWATPVQPNGSQFILAIPYEEWGDRIVTYNMDGEDHQTLYVANSTRRNGGSSWTNEVLLYNSQRRVYERVWSYDFQWSPTPENKYFGWGPIIETFEPYGYGTTNKVGYAEALLVQDTQQYVLTGQNSFIRNDNQGFEITYLDPNYSLLAQ